MINGYSERKFALVGKTQNREHIKRLHGMFADYAYDTLVASAGELEDLIKNSEYDGFCLEGENKKKAVKHADALSDRAREIGYVNTLVRQGGAIVGDNTDAVGFEWMLRRNKINPKHKKVLVLGSGATSKAVVWVLEKLGAEEIVVVSRTGENNYTNLDMHDNAHIIVNTTPIGMYPDTHRSPLSIRYFRDLETVIDVICDPSRTELMLEAEACGIHAVGSLEMLAYKTKADAELFTGARITDYAVAKAAMSLSVEIKNIILVGMPGCGKSTVAKELAKFTGREIIDTDDAVTRTVGISIPEIFELYGEEYFRKCETAVIKNLSRGTGAVVATGAGAILREENIKELRRNSVVVFLRREIERMATDLNHSVKHPDALSVLYKERIPLYLAASDVIVDLCDTPRETVRAVIKAVYAKN